LVQKLYFELFEQHRYIGTGFYMQPANLWPAWVAEGQGHGADQETASPDEAEQSSSKIVDLKQEEELRA
jgi:hypothetical protein